MPKWTIVTLLTTRCATHARMLYVVRVVLCDKASFNVSFTSKFVRNFAMLTALLGSQMFAMIFHSVLLEVHFVLLLSQFVKYQLSPIFNYFSILFNFNFCLARRVTLKFSILFFSRRSEKYEKLTPKSFNCSLHASCFDKFFFRGSNKQN